MSIADQIAQNLVNPEKHAPILKALITILEDEGEKGLKARIAQWIKEIQDETLHETRNEE